MSFDSSEDLPVNSTRRRSAAGAIVGWVLGALSALVWLIGVPISTASKFGSSKITIENEMILITGALSTLLGAIAVGVLLAKLGDQSTAARTARNTLIVLVLLAAIGWLLPAMG